MEKEAGQPLRRKDQNIDFLLFLMVAALILIGTVMVYSSSSAIADGSEKFSSHAFFLKRQLIWLCLAFVTMLITASINLDHIRRLIVPAMLASFLLLVVVFLTPQIRDTHRWLSVGPITLQPSELFKFMLVFYLAHSLSQKGRHLDDVRSYLWPYGPIIGLGALLIILEPDLGSVLVLGATAILILFLAGARLTHMVLAIGSSSLAVYLLVFVLGYKKSRVDSYLASLADPMQAPHQVKQAILSLANGGIFGVGLGNGVFKQFFLPEPHTDFIFASIGEELGLLGLTITLALLLGVIWRGLKIASRQDDRYRFLLATGLTVCLAVNIIINIAVVLGMIPTTGLTLPFLSYGGSSLVMSSAAIGVLLNLSRGKARPVW
jgi:cell division protein FtsW